MIQNLNSNTNDIVDDTKIKSTTNFAFFENKNCQTFIKKVFKLPGINFLEKKPDLKKKKILMI